MDILCCCGHLRSKKKLQHEEEPELPTVPPPARLPPPGSQPIAASPGSTNARSSLTNPLPGAAADASVQLGELIIEDSDDDNADHDVDDPVQGSKNRSGSTLHAVKSRIRRHLSQDSLSRQSETEEQIAHRAEVKRLLRKRIQEELQSEADVLSSESSTPSRIASAHVHPAVSGPRDTIEFTVNRNKRDKELARLKACHLARSKEQHRRRLSKAISNKSSRTSITSENHRPSSRAASVPDLVDASRISQVDSVIGLREHASLPSIPNSPALLPVRSLGFHDASSLASWRLSLSADKLDDLFTPDPKLSLFRPVANSPASCSMADAREFEPFKRHRSKSSPLTIRGSNTASKFHSRQVSLHSTIRERIPASQSLVRDESPVGLWLRTQNLHFRSSTTSRPTSEHEFEDHFIQELGAHQAEEGRIDAILACRQLGLRESSRSIDTIEKGNDTLAATALASEDAQRVSVDNLLDPAGCVSDAHTAVAPNTHIAFSPSSLSATMLAVDSAVRTPNNKPLPEPPRRGFGGLKLPSLKCKQPTTSCQHGSSKMHAGSQSSTKSRKSLRSKQPGRSLPGRSTRSFSFYSARRTPIEPGSENSSFLRRETELRAVEERFRDSHLRTEPLVPVESKFKEIFDHEDLESSNRHSLLLRLHLDVPKRDKSAGADDLDGNGSDNVAFGQEPLRNLGAAVQTLNLDASDQGHLKVPVVDHRSSREKSSGTSLQSSRKSGESGRVRGFSSSKDGDETAQMWKRALRTDTKSRSSKGSDSINIPPAPAQSRAGGSSDGVTKIPQSPGNQTPDSSRGLHSPTCKRRPSQDDEATLQQALERSSTVLRHWAHQLERQEDEARGRGRVNASASSSPLQATKIPPASWARFPSHNRHERNAAAGVADHVKSKDFAIKDISVAGAVNWTTDKSPDDLPPSTHTSRSFHDKFTHTFKTRWSKLIPGRARTQSTDRSMHGGRRSSVQAGGDLEYPELELLPSAGRYKELRALERGIDEMKGCKTRRRSSSDNVTVQHGRPSLTDQMASTLQQHDGSSEAELSKTSDTASLFEGKASMVRIQSPDTPATQIHLPEAAHMKDCSGSTVERYATPFSHLTPSEQGSSPEPTPDCETDSGIPLITHSPGSDKCAACVVKRASTRSTPDTSLPTEKVDARHGRARPQRSSVPMPVGPGLV